MSSPFLQPVREITIYQDASGDLNLSNGVPVMRARTFTGSKVGRFSAICASPNLIGDLYQFAGEFLVGVEAETLTPQALQSVALLTLKASMPEEDDLGKSDTL